jgi:membrane protease YdiL (CAAX protease family)
LIEEGEIMNHITTEPFTTDPQSLSAPKALRTTLVLSAWVGTLLLSRFPQIVLSELGVIAPSDWRMWWWILTGTALLALTYIWTAVRPLRGFFLVMTMIYVITVGLSLLEGTTIWISMFGPERSWLISFFGERVGVVLMALGMVGFLALLGRKRRDYYFALGDLNAPAAGIRFPWSENPLPWKVAGPLIALLLTALFTMGILAMNPLTVTAAEVLPLLPAVFLLALMNAFGEEMFFRAGPLSQLGQVVGKRQAIWMTALWFGLGHYSGGVSFGAMGVVYLTLVAVLFGKAMVETRGLAVPVFMHLWGDVVLYIILAVGFA